MTIQPFADQPFIQKSQLSTGRSNFALNATSFTKEGETETDVRNLIEQQPLFPVNFSDDDDESLSLAPSAVFLGVSQGPVLNAIAQRLSHDRLPPGAAAFGILPIGGSTPEDLIGFLSQPLMTHKMNLGPLGDLRVSVGPVATVLPDSPLAESTVQGGVGATFSPPPLRLGNQEIPALAFMNFRQATQGGEDQPELTPDEVINGDEIRLPEGLYTVNFGVAFSLLGASAAALQLLGRLLAMVPQPAIAAAGHSMLKLQQALNGIQQVGDLKAGLGWSLQAEVDSAGEITFRLGGKVVDPMQLVKDALSENGLPELPMLDNPENDPSVADVNDTIALINGGNPFAIAQQSVGRSEAPAIRLAQEASDAVAVLGHTFYPFLSEQAQSLVAHGPQSPADVASFFQEIWNNPAVPRPILDDLVRRFSNGYNIDFGIPAIAVANEAFAPAEDYEFTRSAFGLADFQVDQEIPVEF